MDLGSQRRQTHSPAGCLSASVFSNSALRFCFFTKLQIKCFSLFTAQNDSLTHFSIVTFCFFPPQHKPNVMFCGMPTVSIQLKVRVNSWVNAMGSRVALWLNYMSHTQRIWSLLKHLRLRLPAFLSLLFTSPWVSCQLKAKYSNLKKAVRLFDCL